MKKYAVVTFLFNDYDLLREPLVVDDGVDYYCLTDDKTLTSKTWKIVYLEHLDTNELEGIQKTYMAKYSFYKYISNDYEYFVTIDASIEVASSLLPIIQMMDDEGYNIGLSMHNYRSIWNSEYREWIRHRGLNENYLKLFEHFSKKMGYDPNTKTGLIECTMKIYKNTFMVKLFIQEVYNTLNLLVNFSDKNDQCYFTCILGRYLEGLNPFFFSRQLYSNSKYFNLYRHKTNSLCINEVAVENNPNILFGKTVSIKKF